MMESISFSTNHTNRNSGLKIIILFILLLASLYYDVNAIPAFARKYKTSCATCHIAVSKRNSFGEIFRRNGYVMAKQNMRLIKEPPLKLGADAWKDVWPEAIWPSDIPASFPLAAYTHMRMQYDPARTQGGNKFDFSMPFDFGLLFGGAFGEDVGFFGSWSYNYGLNRLFFTINDFIGPKNLFNIKIGRFEPGITEGYVSNQRLTMEYPYQLEYAASGDWKPRTTQSGIELNGIAFSSLQYVLGIVNGEGRILSDLSDDKDFYARLAIMFGGAGFDGEYLYIDSTFNNSHSQLFSESTVTLGLYTYYGNTLKSDTSKKSFNNAFLRYGFDVRLELGELELTGGLIYGIDKHPFLNKTELKSMVYFIEASHRIYPWLIGIIRFESIKSEYASEEKDNFIRLVPNICILFRQNIRLSIEGLFNVFGDRKMDKEIITVENQKYFKWLKMNVLFVF